MRNVLRFMFFVFSVCIVSYIVFLGGIYGITVKNASDVYHGKLPKDILISVICKGANYRISESSDGSVWVYGDNYFFMLSDGEKPDFAAVSSRGVSDARKRIERFASDECFFKRKSDICFSDEYGDNLFTVYSKRDSDSFIAVDNSDFGVIYDFSHYFQNMD